ncbi:carboxypeptidase-like regulatory domain-containing protein [Mariniflexile litorale]|uniref:Carboxypeptidase-like regulatory domain-containing protein n=1 Tax=Mariniflexile litorale TaxID=3045158 RepID=A0AAU7EL89_9FLAO|nr:carboxypeptidase-like regulatory domain-containing protein [Mariniflexile sp. KMM 9835]MDQ8211211.1 carboxypeptidase-like regulatory domain-containing protein [Mariniflexile sp. KMM 9835]
MKHLIYIALFLFTALSFGQNTGLIVGKVLDNELNDAPLVLANVLVKGTSINLNTDLTGVFVIENLEAGDYTLVCSFAGYETKEINVHVDALQATEIKLSLAASTISLSELALLTSVAQEDTKSTAVIN